MERSTRQVLAGGLVAATVIPYVGYAIGGEMPFIEDARGMAFTGLVLGAVAWFILGARAFGARWLGIGGALVAAALGIVAAVLETGTASSVFLGAFVALMVAMYLVSVYEYLRDTGGRTHRRLTARHT
jgi:peptidoglycan/LPS O-acetylase OafA/YrhL